MIKDTYGFSKHNYFHSSASHDEWTFFAELSVAFFSSELMWSEYYPFTNSQLENYDRMAFEMLEYVYGVSGAKPPRTHQCYAGSSFSCEG
jgi:hypothetical protein